MVLHVCLHVLLYCIAKMELQVFLQALMWIDLQRWCEGGLFWVGAVRRSTEFKSGSCLSQYPPQVCTCAFPLLLPTFNLSVGALVHVQCLLCVCVCVFKGHVGCRCLSCSSPTVSRRDYIPSGMERSFSHTLIQAFSYYMPHFHTTHACLNTSAISLPFQCI